MIVLLVDLKRGDLSKELVHALQFERLKSSYRVNETMTPFGEKRVDLRSCEPAILNRLHKKLTNSTQDLCRSISLRRFASDHSLARVSPALSDSSLSMSSPPDTPSLASSAKGRSTLKRMSLTFTRKTNSAQDRLHKAEVSEALRKCYIKSLKPLEEQCLFPEFHSSVMEEAEFDSKPMVLLMGQYSTGKTTFIKHLMGDDFPGMRIGPEPTTDRFSIISYSSQSTIIPGNALVVDKRFQFRPLAKFGSALLNRLQCCTQDSPLLQSLTLIDTPGVLAGEKQRLLRGYDYTAVIEWFAQKVDRILILFDANKLDISDELRRAIWAIRAHDDKIRIVLNKCDTVRPQQLMRVYGALLWSLGKVLHTPEVVRVYIGSFWNNPLKYEENRELFNSEQLDLFQDLKSLPRQAAVRKINDFIKRARAVKIHAIVIAELARRYPSIWGKEKKKKELIDNLDKVFISLQEKHGLIASDFSDLESMKEKLKHADWNRFKGIDPKLIARVDVLLSKDMAKVFLKIPDPQLTWNTPEEAGLIMNGPIDAVVNQDTPFADRQESWNQAYELKQLYSGLQGWEVANHVDYHKWAMEFDGMEQAEGKITGLVAKADFLKSKLPNPVLSKIWTLSDIDTDGKLGRNEYCLARYLIDMKVKENLEIPSELPLALVPPSDSKQD